MTLNLNNRTNLDSQIWGDKGWFFLESIVLTYPNNPSQEQKKEYKQFFYTLPTVLPCEKCRNHFYQFITKYPLNNTILKSKNNLILWLLTAHNNIKKINGEKEIKLKEFYDYYNKVYKTDIKLDGCNDKCKLTELPTNLLVDDQEISLFTICCIGFIIGLCLYFYRTLQLKIITS